MTELLLPMHGNMCVVGLKSFKFVLRGSAPRPWLVMQTHQAETRNPKPETQRQNGRNPKPRRRGKAKPETQTRAKPRQGEIPTENTRGNVSVSV